ncbi:hypothetical protein [Streptomyces fodineus]|uniref:hypothetical protein n=1 Tax=Streptomyces fodineus TaxID=1904616 RepID=UPI001D04A2FD|nr:hypothetical protein [Streptomyces fodineus]
MGTAGWEVPAEAEGVGDVDGVADLADRLGALADTDGNGTAGRDTAGEEGAAGDAGPGALTSGILSLTS